MKSFRLYRPIPVERFVSDYSAEEREGFQEKFRPVADAYRRRMRKALLVLGASLICGIFSFAIPTSHPGWGVGGIMACMLVLLFFTTARCECPGCHNDLARGLGAYCPECGARSLQQNKWLGTGYCLSCGKELLQGKGHRYKVRACTHCGLFLDARGL